MLQLLFKLIYFVLWLFDVALLVYVVLSWLHPASNKWTEMLKRFVEPVLTPVRRLIMAKLPAKWQIVDWSPVGAWLLVAVVRWLVAGLEGILL